MILFLSSRESSPPLASTSQTFCRSLKVKELHLQTFFINNFICYNRRVKNTLFGTCSQGLSLLNYGKRWPSRQCLHTFFINNLINALELVILMKTVTDAVETSCFTNCYAWKPLVSILMLKYLFVEIIGSKIHFWYLFWAISLLYLRIIKGKWDHFKDLVIQVSSNPLCPYTLLVRKDK